jgi:hypothetical protein
MLSTQASLLSNNIKIFHVLNILNSYNSYSQLNIFQKQKIYFTDYQCLKI